jgi:hypothetical protein
MCFRNGAVAQLVEQWTENPCVAGSTPAHTTIKQKKPDTLLKVSGFFMGFFALWCPEATDHEAVDE